MWGFLLRSPRFPEGRGASIELAKAWNGVWPRDGCQGTDAWPPHHGSPHHAFSRWPRPFFSRSLVQGWLAESPLLPSNESAMVFCDPGFVSARVRCVRFDRATPWSSLGDVDHVRLSHADVFNLGHSPRVPIHFTLRLR